MTTSLTRSARHTVRCVCAFWVLTLATGCAKKAPPAPAPQAIPVTFAKVQQKDMPVYLRAVGTLRPNQVANLACDRSGTIVSMPFEVGHDVKRADILLQLDSSVETASLKAAQAQLKQSEFNYKEIDRLYKEEVDSEFQREKALDERDNAKATVEQKQATLDKMTVRAPFDGVISITYVNLGNYLSPGEVFVTLVQDDPLKLDYYVSERYVRDLAVGQTVLIDIPHAETKADGKVSAVNPAVTEGSRAIRIQGLLPNPDRTLTAGVFALINHQIGTQKGALVIPQQAIAPTQIGPSVFVVDDGKVKRMQVELGEYVDDDVIVTKGLDAGQQIVLTGWQKLSNGDKVVEYKAPQTQPAASQPTGASTSESKGGARASSAAAAGGKGG